MNNVKLMLEASGLSQSDLAKKVGVSQQAVWKWINQEADPRWDLAPSLATVLSCTIADLFVPAS